MTSMGGPILNIDLMDIENYSLRCAEMCSLLTFV